VIRNRKPPVPKGRPLVRSAADRERLRGLLQIRLDQVTDQLKTAGGIYTTARLKAKQDLLLELWGVALQGTRTATAFADGGPHRGPEPTAGDDDR